MNKIYMLTYITKMKINYSNDTLPYWNLYTISECNTQENWNSETNDESHFSISNV